MYQPIATLPGSDLHRAAIDLYQRHRDGDDGGRCSTCGQIAPCPASRHASAVIAAANDDPHRYDRRLADDELQSEDASRHAAGRDYEGRRSQPFVSFAQSWLPAQLPPRPHPSIDTPGVGGWHVGGVGRRADVPYVDFDR